MSDRLTRHPEKVSRRDFARQVAMATAAAAVLPASILPAAAEAAAPPQAATTSKALSPEAQAEVEQKYQAILRQYGSRLSAEQRKDIHRLLVEGQPALEKLRAFSLENSNEPATLFNPFFGRLPPHRSRREAR
jgi:hypothetical protein